MLQIKNICKTYKTGELEQVALNNVSLNFRDNEFVAVLGPSGSGKTTMLNIVGGLDRYDSGDLIINGISTKHYSDKDWDAYRNHTIGFVFQSYNLISHQTILSNVELSLTLSGISPADRKAKATAALEAVGLGDQLHKKPNQLSGGQMQRVAIARALVNEPDIIMADEPTGALDSDTSLQIMDLLKEVAKDRLVIMVTHNPELAETYATRIIRLKDGEIVSDTDPADSPDEDASIGKKPHHTRLGFSTAVGLSLNNLMTKKGRTFLTAFAGAIGIIGIALIMAMSNGANNYIASKESEMMGSYPIQLEKQTYDLSGFMEMASDHAEAREKAEDRELDKIYSNNIVADSVKTTQELLKKNNLGKFKIYLDKNMDRVKENVSAIEYKYGIKPQVFRKDDDNDIIQVSPASLTGQKRKNAMGMSSSSSMLSAGTGSSWAQLVTDQALRESQYTLLSGNWPEKYNEAVLIITENNEVSDFSLYTIGLLDMKDMDNLIDAVKNEKPYEDPVREFSYEKAIGRSFKVFSPSQLFEKEGSSSAWIDKSEDKDFIASHYNDGLDITITGVIQSTDNAQIRSGVAYTAALTDKLIDIAADSAIVKQQIADPKTNVLTGEEFKEEDAKKNTWFMGKNQNILKGSEQNAAPRELKSNTTFQGTGKLTAAADAQALKNKRFGVARTAETEPLREDQMPEEGSEGSQIDLSQLFEQMDPEALAQLLAGMDQETLVQVMTQLPQETLYILMGEAYRKMLTETFEQMDQAAIAKIFEQLDSDTIAKLMSKIDEKTMAGLLGQIDQSTMASYFAQNPEMVTQFIQQMDQETLAKLMGSMDLSSLYGDMSAYMDQEALAAMYGNYMMDEAALATLFGMPDFSEEELALLMAQNSSMTPSTYEDVLLNLGYADKNEPTGIDIFPKDFEGKDAVSALIDEYNNQVESDADNVTFTDFISLAMDSITSIIDTISAVLIAFVAISLVVSSIMIAIITYVSVLERTKEIGILRAIGASKNDVSKIFNAETFIEGLISGALGVGVALLVCLLANAVIDSFYDLPELRASIPLYAVVALIIISVILTFIAGFIPSRIAAKKDPVEALRTA